MSSTPTTSAMTPEDTMSIVFTSGTDMDLDSEPSIDPFNSANPFIFIEVK